MNGSKAPNARPPETKEELRARLAGEALALQQELLRRHIRNDVEHLKAAGASEVAIREARPGLMSARIIMGRLKNVLGPTFLILLAVPVSAYIELVSNASFIRSGGFVLYPLLWMYPWNTGLAEATRYAFGAGVFVPLFVYVVFSRFTQTRVTAGPTLFQQSGQARRISRVNSWSLAVMLLLAPVAVIFSWLQAMQALANARPATQWDGILLVLVAIWSFMIASLLFRTVDRFCNWTLNSLFPGFALVTELCDALDVVRDENLWYDAHHRMIALRHLARAADIVDGPMLRRCVAVAGSKNRDMLRRGPKAIADGLRAKLAWLVTPKPDTRVVLEKTLCEAILAAALGQLDRLAATELQNTSADAATLLTRSRIFALTKGIVIAFAPFALLWLATRVGMISLSDADSTVARNAAMLWFVLAVVRALDPEIPKAISEASGGWIGLFGKKG